MPCSCFVCVFVCFVCNPKRTCKENNISKIKTDLKRNELQRRHTNKDKVISDIKEFLDFNVYILHWVL